MSGLHICITVSRCIKILTGLGPPEAEQEGFIAGLCCLHVMWCVLLIGLSLNFPFFKENQSH